jgi:catechol 2,3-dioxygenase-like lactoylglutathione lyase family enzyme|uniref:VOC domain-containing protein n=1 Tax=Desulfomonile tiedjei TaxID=2358 RepID=A0A7C4AR31_9BACT
MKTKLPAGHARRLFLGFTCSIMFLVAFGLLIAHNTEAESASFSRASLDDYPLTIGIPTADPEQTIKFYTKLGFKQSEGFSGGLDKVCMEKEGTPYKLEICHNRFTEAGPLAGGVSGMSFKVKNLASSVEELKRKGITFVETQGHRDGVAYASINDPNGISIKLFEH